MIQKSSSKLLLFHVEDILGMAQLKTGKFRKVIGKFSVKTAIDEIMNIQKFSSEIQNIRMNVEFIDFPDKDSDAILPPRNHGTVGVGTNQ